jgi:hypothetical protein
MNLPRMVLLASKMHFYKVQKSTETKDDVRV